MRRTLLVIRLVILFNLPCNFHFQCSGADHNDNHRQYFKLLYVSPFSNTAQNILQSLAKKPCTDLDIKLVFTPFKIRSLFGVKNTIPRGLRSCIVYKFSCTGRNACYVGETNRHFDTGVRKHLSSDKYSHIYKHLRGSEHCNLLLSDECFKIIDSASVHFQLKIKEAMHMLWEQLSLNMQLKHLNLFLSY